jgi:hypothetical protein
MSLQQEQRQRRVIVDPTTRNNIYNPLSAQGRWIKHRWGKRDYPVVDIELEKVLHALDSISEGFFLFDRPIYLKSAYGDAALWPDVTRISKIVGSGLTVTTYGMIDHKVATTIKRHKSMLHFLIDGYREECGKIFHGANWNELSGLLTEISSNAIVEFFVYEHNKHQIPNMIRFCKKRNIKLKFTTGEATDNNSSCIIDQDGNWLYDVIPHKCDTELLDLSYGSIEEINLGHDLKDQYSDLEPVELTRLMPNYSSLRTYIKPPKGKTIIEYPMVSKIHDHNTLSQRFNIESIDYILTPTGHVCTSSEEYYMFVNMLCSDWLMNSAAVKEIHSSDTFLLKVLYYAQKFNRQFLETHQSQNYFQLD